MAVACVQVSQRGAHSRPTTGGNEDRSGRLPFRAAESLESARFAGDSRQYVGHSDRQFPAVRRTDLSPGRAAAYPELRLVAVMHGDNLSYAETFEKALQGLLTEAGKKPPPALALGLKGEKIPLKELIFQANEAFKNYLRLQGEGRFDDAAKELTRLQEALQQLAKQLE